MPLGPPAPEPAAGPPAPRHRARQPATTAGVRPGGAQEEAVAVLAHLQQAHPLQEVTRGPGRGAPVPLLGPVQGVYSARGTGIRC